MNKGNLAQISHINFQHVIESIKNTEKQVLFIFSCGYEERSLAQYKILKEHIDNDKIAFLCFGFTSYKSAASRPANDKLLNSDGIEPIEIETTDWESAWYQIKKHIHENYSLAPSLYIDYSSMPRNWYCMLAVKMVRRELGDSVTFTYSHGKYFQEQYPCVGYGEFYKFSGRPNITSTKEINIFGLGFDSTRTHGIWTYLDPQISVSVIAKSPHNQQHCERVRKENPEIISASESVHEVSIEEFSNTLSTLVDLTRKLLHYGDVALVPDGPKPLVIAMSLVPIYLDTTGVYCWHVGHVKPEGYEPIDILSSGDFFCFGLL